MAQRSLIPKQRILTETESQTSFESWKQSMLFHIALDGKSARFLSDLKTWSSAANHGFTDDSNDVREEVRMTKEAKSCLLEFILGSVATYAPVISARFIQKQSTSLESIFDRLRGHYGFRKTGGRVLDLPQLRQDTNESREALWERIYTFSEELLLTKDCCVKHENATITEDETFTPTILNILVAIWLNIINPALPSMVQQRFATALRNNTVFSIRDEISDSIPILLAELQEKEGLINRNSSNNYQYQRSKPKQRYQQSNRPKCCLCDAAGRPALGHFLSACPFLPANDKKFMSKAREVIASFDENEFEEHGECEYEQEDYEAPNSNKISMVSLKHSINDIYSRRVDIVLSPVLQVRRNGKASLWTLDSGAEASLIRESECNELNVKILPTRQRARMADGASHLPIIGEAHFTAQWGHHDLKFSGLVVKNLDSPVLAGMPFLMENDVSIRYSQNIISIGDCCSINYSQDKTHRSPSIKSVASVLRISHQACILPGDEIKFQLPEPLCNESLVALEPRFTVPADMPSWLDCKILHPNPVGEISFPNNTSEPILVSKHAQICQVRPVTEVPLSSCHTTTKPLLENPISKSPSPCKPNQTSLAVISVDPSGIMSDPQKSSFHLVHRKYKEVFTPGIGKYNGYSGKFMHTINVGPNLPPQRRGRIPEYNKNDRELLQSKFDYLLQEGVFSRAEDINQPVEYVHPSFLVKKPSGGHRLVTSFGEVAEHARPQPTVNSNVEHVLHNIGQFKYIIKCDLSSAYYQIPLNPESSKYVGVLTPFKGTFIYRRSVMGLPGSEAALEEILSRIFGDMVKEGKMVKLMDDLYVGSESIDSLILIWEEVLHRLSLNGLKLGIDKTIICPTSTNILG